jgi:uncharacterized protein YcbK (DUF882 family)
MSLIGKRDFLRTVGMAAAAAAIGARPAFSAPRADLRIRLHNIHTGESVNTVYRTPEGYDESALGDIDRVLRDFRTGDVFRIDPALIDLVHTLSSKVGATRSFDVICGYRSPKTNAMLAAASSGVSKRSYHMQGKAIDLSLPGYDLRDLHAAAKLMKRGGVGLYASSGFIHVDTGPVRYW